MAQTYDLGGGGNSFPFDRPGDAVQGKIINITEVQQTDMDSGQPATWDNGQPKMMVAVELQTTLRDPENPADDGKRTVYLKGSRKPESLSSMAAVLVAVKNATGSTQLNVGGELGLRYTGDGVPPSRGKNPPKQYDAMYRPPAVNLGADQWQGQQSQVANDRAGFAQAQGQQGGGFNSPPPQAGGGWGTQNPNGNPVPNPNTPDPATDPEYAAYQQWKASQGG